MIFTDSAFYYGIEVTEDNRILFFDEGNGALVAQLVAGKYSLTDLASETARALNEAGLLDYSVTVDRQSRLITISASDPFDLLLSESGNQVFGLLGFTGADKEGSDSYTGTLPVGLVYRPQFRLQGFVDFADNQKAVESTLNTSASGRVEVVRFGVARIMECEIRYITDIPQSVGSYFFSNPNGVLDARAFMIYAVTKGPMEFIPDICNPAIFTKCLLESTPESSIGVDFKLKELFTQNLPGYYTTGLLNFREVN